MKLIIQIPCFNEEQSLGIVLSQLPRKMLGIERIEWLVIDDGSTDKTLEVARAFGVDHIVQLPSHQGLAAAYMRGIQSSLARGADIILNLDGDNQYAVEDIPLLLKPLLENTASLVIGSRAISKFPKLPVFKQILYKVVQLVISSLSGMAIDDPVSGFRAMTRDCAEKMRVLGNYTYTIETLLQAAFSGIAIQIVPIRTNRTLRRSRLIRSNRQYIYQAVRSVIRSVYFYQVAPIGRNLFGSVNLVSGEPQSESLHGEFLPPHVRPLQ